MGRKITPCKNGEKEEFHKGWDLFNNDWFLSPKGDMYSPFGRYEIVASRLKEDDWCLHLSDKTWYDENTFLPAYLEACRRAGIREVKIITYY